MRVLQPVEGVQLQAQLLETVIGQGLAALSFRAGGVQRIEGCLQGCLELQEERHADLGCEGVFHHGGHFFFLSAFRRLNLQDHFFGQQAGFRQPLQKHLLGIRHIGDGADKQGFLIEEEADLIRNGEEGRQGLQGNEVFSVLGDHGDVIVGQTELRDVSVAVPAAGHVQQERPALFVYGREAGDIDVRAGRLPQEAHKVIPEDGFVLEVERGVMAVFPGKEHDAVFFVGFGFYLIAAEQDGVNLRIQPVQQFDPVVQFHEGKVGGPVCEIQGEFFRPGFLGGKKIERIGFHPDLTGGRFRRGSRIMVFAGGAPLH